MQKLVDGIAWAVWLLGVIWLPIVLALPVAGGGRAVAARAPLRQCSALGRPVAASTRL